MLEPSYFRYDSDSNNESGFKKDHVAQILAQFFDQDELDTLCFDLGIEWRNLKGDTLFEKVDTLLEMCIRENITQNLIDAIAARRVHAGLSSSGKEYSRLDSQLMQLRNWLSTHFDQNEIRTLCFDLGISWSNIRGETLQVKIIELIKQFKRNDRIQQLEQYILRNRTYLMNTTTIKPQTIAERTMTARPHENETLSPQEEGALRKIIVDAFSLEELKTLCWDLKLDYDNLGGEGKSGKVRELIAYMKRRNTLSGLTEKVNLLRPHLKNSWLTSALNAAQSVDAPVMTASVSTIHVDASKAPKLEIEQTAVSELSLPQRRTLFEIMKTRMNLLDIQTVSLLLKIDYETLAGNTINDKARELLLHTERRGQIRRLLSAIHSNRPDINLSDFGIPHTGTVAAQTEVQQTKPNDIESDTSKQLSPIEVYKYLLTTITTMSDTQRLTQELNVNIDALSGDTVPDKLRELILLFGRTGRNLGEINSALKKIRSTEVPKIALDAVETVNDHITYLTAKLTDFDSFKSFCKDLNVNPDHLSGPNLPDKIRSLVIYFRDRGQLSKTHPWSLFNMLKFKYPSD